MLTVKYCCCGCTLETGTSYILFTSVMIASLSFYRASKKWVFVWEIMLHFLRYFVLTICPFLGYYGVLLRIPVLLIPFLGFQMLLMGVGIFMMVTLPFANRTVLTLLGADSSYFTDDFKDVLALFIIFLETLILLLEILNVYCFIVVLSYYKELKRGSSTLTDTDPGRT